MIRDSRRADNVRAWVFDRDRRAPDAQPVAEAIVRAATDQSWRLRYPVRGGAVLTLRAILPDAAWRAMMGAGMTRRPRSS